MIEFAPRPASPDTMFDVIVPALDETIEELFMER
jgi:hypothetical protein